MNGMTCWYLVRVVLSVGVGAVGYLSFQNQTRSFWLHLNRNFRGINVFGVTLTSVVGWLVNSLHTSSH
ncbi:hypothetical protein BC833DRAFT_594357 [Globomyces pollinis-pini]|nr:hypothetical protein BC833DRAFT_594357 [Globomyces pollinis-pini]